MRPTEMVLVAAGLDWLEGLLPVVFVLIWIVSQILNLFRKAAGKPAGQQVQPPRPPARPPRPAAAERPGDLGLEIEEFLMRSRGGGHPPAEKFAAGKVQPQAPARLPQPVVVRPGQQGRKPPTPPRRVSVPSSTASQPRPTPPGLGRGLEGHGTDIADHVTAAFAHDLAHEVPAGTASESALPADSVAAALVAALRTPAGLQQLVLMREVLDRPTHRW